MSRASKQPRASLLCFPRVSGDEPRVQVIPAPRLLFSPRERG